MHILLVTHLEGFGLFGIRAKDGKQIFELPLLDIIVLGIHPVDEALDGVAFVADDEARSVSNALSYGRIVVSNIIGFRPRRIMVETS